ncbi:sulfotransferase family 2 domain-containing protein [Pseudoalteromonas piratica]|uniref:Sulfotransferase family protein n=1 Tax=Pseudoalteromonas piratica TaxID=1348114 RepID=A0A0A7EF52_9GAMM|nr:sulfotransferase family 2 domain-containing protein [Pseudoalteromonas piratica]AIY64602.1 hypothetical protein OM33_05140 [Pseudoalteromonas piratica]
MTRLTWPENANLYLPKYKILYCPIAKNACTSLKGLMLELSGYDIENNCVHSLLDSGEAKLQMRFYSEEQQRSILYSSDAFRFAVFREPVERLISAYVEKFVVNRFDKSQWVHTKPVMAFIQKVAVDEVDIQKSITFREFAHYILRQKDSDLDTHWRSQSSYLRGVHYTHLYSIKNLAQLRLDLYRYIGQERSIPHKNQASTQAIEKLDSEPPLLLDRYPSSMEGLKLTKHNFLDDELIAELKRKYAIDYAIYDNL